MYYTATKQSTWEIQKTLACGSCFLNFPHVLKFLSCKNSSLELLTLDFEHNAQTIGSLHPDLSPAVSQSPINIKYLILIGDWETTGDELALHLWFLSKSNIWSRVQKDIPVGLEPRSMHQGPRKQSEPTQTQDYCTLSALWKTSLSWKLNANLL